MVNVIKGAHLVKDELCIALLLKKNKLICLGQASTRTSARREPSQVSAKAVAREVFPTPAQLHI